MVKSKHQNTDGARRAQVANACLACRGSKVKCSGKHPQCTRCRSRGLRCEYDVSEEGMTKRQHLCHELYEQKQELDHARSVLDVLRHGTDAQAAATLARLRLGQSLRQEHDFFGSHIVHQQQQQDSMVEFCVRDSPMSPMESPEVLMADQYAMTVARSVTDTACCIDPFTTLSPTISPISPTWPRYPYLPFDMNLPHTQDGIWSDQDEAKTEVQHVEWVSQPCGSSSTCTLTQLRGPRSACDGQRHMRDKASWPTGNTMGRPVDYVFR